MEDQASSLQLDLIDNGLSHNGNNLSGIDITDSFQTQKIIEHAIDIEGSNGINILDAASSTTSEIAADQIAIDIIKKVRNSSNGVEQSIESASIDNHQDDDLMRELEQFEGSKKDDDLTLMLPKSSTTEENGSNIQDTSDLLKDLESDSPCPGPSESEIESTPINSIIGDALPKDCVELMDVDQIIKSDDVQVDSTTESTQKRKNSAEIENVAKRANIDITTDKANVPDVLNTDTQKSTSEIDSDTESKLLQENSDGEASMSDVVELISSTSTVTKITSDITTEKLVDIIAPSNEDLEVSSSGSLDAVQATVESTKDVEIAAASTVNVANLGKSTESKGDAEVSSNKMNDTTEKMEHDLDETVEADRIGEHVTSNENTSSTSEIKLPTESAELGSKKIDSSKPETVDSSEPKPSKMEIESEPQSADLTQKTNGLPGVSAEGSVDDDIKTNTVSVSESLAGSGKVEAVTEPIPVERTFEIRMFYEESELKSLTVERLEKKNTDESTSVTEQLQTVESSEPTKHTANGIVDLCNFMINHFSAIKKSLNVDEDNTTPKVTTQRGRGSSKKSATQAASPSQTTPKSGKRGSATKRSLDKTDVDESESKSKQAKNSSISEKSADEDVEIKGDCCLARWTDRKYYAGRVIDEKPGNKFVVLFEDGASKVLASEVIVFGTGNVLPLMDHSVHVLVSDDTYEPGLVTKIDTEGETVQYTVAAESKTITCSASDIYLMDDQAKAIHNTIKSKEASMKTPETPSSKRTGRLPAKLEETLTPLSGGRSSRGKKSQPAVSPEPGFSGDADTKKSGRRSNKSNERTRRKKLRDESEWAKENSSLNGHPYNNLSELPAELSEEEQIKSMKWLENSRTPKMLVYEHWKKCFIIRQNFLKENRGIKSILLAWPILGTPMCPALINIDFETQYGDKTQLFKMWPDFVDKFQLLVKQIKDSHSKKFAKNLKNALTDDGRNIVICYLLSSLIVSTFKKNVSKANREKDIWRPSIEESRKAFIVHAQNSIQLEMEIEKRKKLVKDKGLNFQPMLIVLGGEEIFEGRYFYTCYDGFVQKCKHFIEALDFTFKLTRVLRLEYAEDCSQI